MIKKTKEILWKKKKSLRLTVCGLPSLGEVARIGEQPRGNGRAQTLYRGGHEAPIFPTLASWNPHTSVSASREAMISSWEKKKRDHENQDTPFRQTIRSK